MDCVYIADGHGCREAGDWLVVRTYTEPGWTIHRETEAGVNRAKQHGEFCAVHAAMVAELRNTKAALPLSSIPAPATEDAQPKKRKVARRG